MFFSSRNLLLLQLKRFSSPIFQFADTDEVISFCTQGGDFNCINSSHCFEIVGKFCFICRKGTLCGIGGVLCLR
ncbi:MAG: hypothetical protein PHV05_08570, partial [Candidatus Riflebacteria bacterium]|nr:hypothetical protein [Candidatus Riflebacteria bacterium]